MDTAILLVFVFIFLLIGISVVILVVSLSKGKGSQNGSKSGGGNPKDDSGGNPKDDSGGNPKDDSGVKGTGLEPTRTGKVRLFIVARLHAMPSDGDKWSKCLEACKRAQTKNVPVLFHCNKGPDDFEKYETEGRMTQTGNVLRQIRSTGAIVTGYVSTKVQDKVISDIDKYYKYQLPIDGVMLDNGPSDPALLQRYQTYTKHGYDKGATYMGINAGGTDANSGVYLDICDFYSVYETSYTNITTKFEKHATNHAKWISDNPISGRRGNGHGTTCLIAQDLEGNDWKPVFDIAKATNVNWVYAVSNDNAYDEIPDLAAMVEYLA